MCKRIIISEERQNEKRRRKVKNICFYVPIGYQDPFVHRIFKHTRHAYIKKKSESLLNIIKSLLNHEAEGQNISLLKTKKKTQTKKKEIILLISTYDHSILFISFNLL